MMYWQLFIAFFRVGMLGYGGGPSSIPLVYKEVVDKYQWMDDEDFSDILALGNTLPGPILTKMAGYIGYRVGGWIGMILSLISSVLPSLLLIILLLTALNAYKDLAWVQGMSKAVVPVVGVMLGVMTWDFIKKSKGSLGWTITGVLVILSVILLEVLNIHPAFLIIGLILYAFMSKNENDQRRKEKAS